VTRTPAIAIAAVTLAACTSSRSESIEAGPGALVVVAVVDDRGIAQSVTVGPAADARAVAPLPDEWVAVWSIEASDLVDSSGSPLDASARAALDVRLDSDPPVSGYGGCGRCSVPAVQPPQVLLPGDECLMVSPPAVFAGSGEHEAGEEAIAAAALAQVRLLSPGDCTCEAPELEREIEHDVEICAIGESRGLPFLPRHYAMHEDGRLGVFGQGVAMIAPPGGSPLLHFGRVRAMDLRGAGTLGDDFWVSSRPGDATGAPTQIDLFDDRAQGETLWDEPNIRPRRSVRLGDEHIMVGERRGGVEGGRMFAVKCGFTMAGRRRCADELIPRKDVGDAFAWDENLTDVVVMDSGVVVAISEDGRLLVRPSDGPPWRVLRTDLGLTTLSAPSEALTMIRGNRVFSLGDRIVACGYATTTAGATFDVVMTTTIADVRQSDPPAALADLRARALMVGRPGGWCHGGVPQADGTLLLSFREGHAVSIDPTGRVVEVYDGIGPGPGNRWRADAPEPLRLVDGPARGWWMGLGFTDSVYRAPADGPFERVLGADSPLYTGFTEIAVARDGRRFLAMGTGLTPVWIDPPSATEGCEGFDVSPASIDGFPITAAPKATTATDDGFIVATKAAGVARLWSVRADASCVESQRGPAEAMCRDATCCARMIRHGQTPVDIAATALTEIFGGRVLAVTTTITPPMMDARSELVVLAPDGSVQRLSPDYDDPLTEVEEAPASAVLWSEVSSADGVGWAIGSDGGWSDSLEELEMSVVDGVLARVVPGVDGTARAEAFWGSRTGDPKTCGNIPVHVPLAIASYCPDRVVIASREHRRSSIAENTDNVATGWFLRHDAERCPDRRSADQCHVDGPPGAELHKCEDGRLRQSDHTGRGEHTFAVVRAGNGVAFVMRNGEIQGSTRGETYVRLPEEQIITAMGNEHQAVVASGPASRLYGVLLRAVRE